MKIQNKREIRALCHSSTSDLEVISALPVEHSLVAITAIFVICGCPVMKTRITATNVVFVGLVEEKIFGIVMTVVCVLILFYSMITTVRLENT